MSLSDEDKPFHFGLPANIERSSQRIISLQVHNMKFSIICQVLIYVILLKV